MTRETKSSNVPEVATPRPWEWRYAGRGLILVSLASAKPIVMDFVRCGMQGAEPRFGKRTDALGGVMIPLSEWKDLPPDAALIVEAVNAYDALRAENARYRHALEYLFDHDDACQCDCDDENCCQLQRNEAGPTVFCPRCIARAALKGERSEETS